MMETNGPVSRQRVAPSHSASAIPCRRPDTGFKCGHRRDIRRECDERLRGERKHDKYRTRKAPTEQRRRLTSSALTRYIGTIRRLVSGSKTADEPPPGGSPKLCGTGQRN